MEEEYDFDLVLRYGVCNTPNFTLVFYYIIRVYYK